MYKINLQFVNKIFFLNRVFVPLICEISVLIFFFIQGANRTCQTELKAENSNPNYLMSLVIVIKTLNR